ncbi:MAG: 50S ribosome-binding GTPase [Deltaproteobacteria bacterium]|nr:50S ribosome-binding GTPase [Deltaproteobacteria bacterium]
MTQSFRGDRLHIAVLGRCNTGKSTLLNLIAGQRAAIVSPKAGTTGDPLGLPFELPPLGPVTLYDTAGLDEGSELGVLRRAAGNKILAGADLALVVTDESGIGPWEEKIVEDLTALKTPTLLIFNKADLKAASPKDLAWCAERGLPCLELAADPAAKSASDSTAANQTTSPVANSAVNAESIRLREALLRLAPEVSQQPAIVTDLLAPHSTVICVAPIDGSAPKGRLIAPQVQVLRELLENNHQTLLLQPEELSRNLSPAKNLSGETVNGQANTAKNNALSGDADMAANKELLVLNKPTALVIVDSQALRQVVEILPPQVPVTTFSLLFARLKGDFELLLEGSRSIDRLYPNAPVLIAEACSHHQQDDDIARVKLPKLLEKKTGCKLDFSYCNGVDFPDDLARYALVLHCGACMLTPREMKRRLKICAANQVPVSNFGMAIAHCNGLLERAAAPIVAC